MTTDAYRQKAQALLIVDGGDPLTVLARFMATQDALKEQIASLNAVGLSPRDYPRPAHLARLTDFTIDAALGNRREAARMILRHIDPQLPQRLPDEIDALAHVAAKYYSDLPRHPQATVDSPIDTDALLDDLEL